MTIPQKRVIIVTYDIKKTASDLMIEPDELTEILEIFFRDALDALSECDRAIESPDPGALGKQLHTLKGSSSNFRMESLRVLAAQMEAAARSGNLKAVSSLLPAFRKELHSIQEQVKKYCLHR